MGERSTALACTFLRREKRCGWCRGPWHYPRLCPDVVRHPALTRMLGALADLDEGGEGLGSGVPLDPSTVPAPELRLSAWVAALACRELPAAERAVASCILHHAGIAVDVDELALAPVCA